MQEPTITHQIRSADGSVLFTGRVGYSLLNDFVGRCKAVGGTVVWGDHYRVMIRRKDPQSLVAKCKKTGESLHTY